MQWWTVEDRVGNWMGAPCGVQGAAKASYSQTCLHTLDRVWLWKR